MAASPLEGKVVVENDPDIITAKIRECCMNLGEAGFDRPSVFQDTLFPLRQLEEHYTAMKLRVLRQSEF